VSTVLYSTARITNGRLEGWIREGNTACCPGELETRGESRT